MRCLFRQGSLLAALMIPLSAFAESKYNMTKGATPISHEIHDLHMTIFLICCVIGVVVFGALFYILMHHRKSRGVQAAQFHENAIVEVIWAIIPLLILVVMAVPATRVLIAMHDTTKAALTIKITGYQWKWRYEYLDQGIDFFSNLSTPLDQIHNKQKKDKWYLLDVDHPLVLPTHRKVRFLVTSNDVIHSWWVPALGVKRDAVPGFIYEAWAKIEKPGVYRGQCAELCGVNHGYMPVVVKAVPGIEFDRWVKKQAEAAAAAKAAANKVWTKAELMKKGKSVYEKLCAACHKPDGTGMPPVFPALKNGVITVGPAKGHIEIVLNGVSGTAMQSFAAQLGDADLAAVVTYERNAWGNDQVGIEHSKVVQPQDVKALRK